MVENGNSPKQLLARSRYILAKKESQWTKNQEERTQILFANYPDLKTAYHEVLAFTNIYEESNLDKAKHKFEPLLKRFKKKK